MKVEAILRQGIKRYTDQVGLLWNSLADYFIRSGHFEKVIIPFLTIVTVLDFIDLVFRQETYMKRQCRQLSQ
jgi:pre-mRNA-splicing factor SYF1